MIQKSKVKMMTSQKSLYLFFWFEDGGLCHHLEYFTKTLRRLIISATRSDYTAGLTWTLRTQPCKDYLHSCQQFWSSGDERQERIRNIFLTDYIVRADGLWNNKLCGTAHSKQTAEDSKKFSWHLSSWSVLCLLTTLNCQHKISRTFANIKLPSKRSNTYLKCEL